MADTASVRSELVTEGGSAGRRNQPDEIRFHPVRVLLPGEIEPSREPPDVCIHDYGRFAEDLAEDDVGGLAACARNQDELVHGGGHAAIVILQQIGGSASNAPGLAPEEPEGVHDVLELGELGGCERFGIWVVLPEDRGYPVHALIGGLGRQDGRYQQAEGIVVVVEKAASVWILLLESRK